MRFHRVVLVLAVMSLLGGAAQLRAPSAKAAEACFEETNQCVRGRFLDYWQAHGGLAINGFPLSEERRELLEDGNTYTVQYFERVRMEYHPENQPPFDVLLGQFGRRALQAGDGLLRGGGDTNPATPGPDTAYFPETGQNLGGRFLQYWLVNGGLAQFGYPLTGELSAEYSAPAQTSRNLTVQYFERARFEYHPENPPPYDILLGQLGRRILEVNTLLASEPSFHALFVTTPRVQRVLSQPIGPAERVPGAFLAFERGAMIWRGAGDHRGIYVLCPGAVAGGDVVGTYNDTWREGEPPGGGPGPQPGLYVPARGFGKVWRDNQTVRDCLGYATSPGETGYTQARQGFTGGGGRPYGEMLSVTTPEGRFIYVLFRAIGPRVAYERYPDPVR